MIVKIEVYNDDTNAKFWLFDNIVRVVVGKKRNKPNDFEDDVFVLDTEGVDEYARLSCRDTRDKEFVIAFDTIAYICNDEGKTIEIVPVSSK